MAANISECGLLQPLLVAALPKGAGTAWGVLAGAARSPPDAQLFLGIDAVQLLVVHDHAFALQRNRTIGTACLSFGL